MVVLSGGRRCWLVEYGILADDFMIPLKNSQNNVTGSVASWRKYFSS